VIEHVCRSYKEMAPWRFDYETGPAEPRPIFDQQVERNRKGQQYVCDLLARVGDADR